MFLIQLVSLLCQIRIEKGSSSYRNIAERDSWGAAASNVTPPTDVLVLRCPTCDQYCSLEEVAKTKWQPFSAHHGYLERPPYWLPTIVFGVVRTAGKNATRPFLTTESCLLVPRHQPTAATCRTSLVFPTIPSVATRRTYRQIKVRSSGIRLPSAFFVVHSNKVTARTSQRAKITYL